MIFWSFATTTSKLRSCFTGFFALGGSRSASQSAGLHTCVQLSGMDWAQVVRRGMGSAAVARGGFGLLRQLANSDAIKNAVVDHDGFELINTAVATHIEGSGV